MTRPTRQRERGDDRKQTEGTDEGLDPEELDPEELVRTADGELIHEPSGLVLEEDNIDRGPEWRAK
jgi:transcription initiation factor TFIIB